MNMLKHILAAAVATALLAAPLAPAFAQATTEKSDKKPKKAAAKKSEKKSGKKLTAQQQRMKDCAPKWAAYKKEKSVKGRTEYRKFMSTCLKA
jgi:Ni/Co efflux regulator RcnB